MDTELRITLALTVNSVATMELWWDGRYVGQVVPLEDGPGVRVMAARPMTAEIEETPSWGELTTTVRIAEGQDDGSKDTARGRGADRDVDRRPGKNPG